MMAVSRISAQVIGGAVVITVDPRTAVVVAEAFAEHHRGQPAGDARRYWSAEVDHLVEVAVRAAQVESTRVDVPLVRMAPTSTAGTECDRGPCFLGYGHEGDCKPVRADQLSLILAPEMRRHASISPDGLYRWSLHREWRAPEDRPFWVTFVMLNPSTADALEDDPTIRRCIGFAKALGGTGLAVVNLYAFRATSPADLWKSEDPVGHQNDETLQLFLDMAATHDFPIIAAWGAHATQDRVEAVRAMRGADRLQALHVTKSGAPGHPLYLPAGRRPKPWPGGESS